VGPWSRAAGAGQGGRIEEASGGELLDIIRDQVSLMGMASPDVLITLCWPSEDSCKNAAHSRFHHEEKPQVGLHQWTFQGFRRPSLCVCRVAWGLTRGGGEGADTVYEVFGLGVPWDESGTESNHASHSKAAASFEHK
jgi:hypothetical protein